MDRRLGWPRSSARAPRTLGGLCQHLTEPGGGRIAGIHEERLASERPGIVPQTAGEGDLREADVRPCIGARLGRGEPFLRGRVEEPALEIDLRDRFAALPRVDVEPLDERMEDAEGLEVEHTEERLTGSERRCRRRPW